MRKFLALASILLASLTPACVLAQGFNPAAAPPWVYADNWPLGLPGQAPNTYTFTPAQPMPASPGDAAQLPEQADIWGVLKYGRAGACIHGM